jgi:hypothetical protein
VALVPSDVAKLHPDRGAEQREARTMMRAHARYEMWYREPSSVPLSEYYAAMLGHCEYLDRHGPDQVTISEHHGTDCNWNPSPLIMSSALIQNELGRG